ncbi:MAG: type I methionyl aminopeptidase [Anaerolineae bacterium]|nr:type I methionyl aminopeptidase [Anaerolineae bacterium]
MIALKSDVEIEKMRQANGIVAEVLQNMREWVVPGVTTAELDEKAEALIRDRGAIPSFKGYPPGSAYPFPGAICASVNEELVHGIPSRRVLKEGDIITVDVGTIFDGYHGDAAVTLPVGEVSQEAEDLMAVTEGALEAGIAAAQAGGHSGDISSSIQTYVEQRGYKVVREYTGHGIGREMHEDPQVPNHGKPGHGVLLRQGMTIALEPMVLISNPRVRVLDDHWTVVSRNGKLTAHFERTIAITEGEADVLSRW